MNILFLDDDPWRWRVFSETFPQALWVETPGQANLLIDTVTFDFISLDHDLGLSNQTGMTVVDHLIRKRRPVDRVWIHSWNGPAASAMHLALYRAGIVRNLSREIFCREAVEEMRETIAAQRNMESTDGR